MRKVVVVGALLAAVASLAAKPIPKQLPEVKGLTLGQPIKDFLADFSAKEGESSVRGQRLFDVNANTLPVGVAQLHCEFWDGKLAYFEAQLDAKAVPSADWTAFVSPGIASFGPPKGLVDVVGSNRVLKARLADSAAWVDKKAVLVWGCDGTTSRRFWVALADAKYVEQLAGQLKARSREEDEATKKAVDEQALEARKAQEEQAAVAKRAIDEQQRLRDEAELAKAEAAALKAAANQERAARDATAAREVLVTETRAALTVAPRSCTCLPGGAISVRCHVRSDARVPAIVSVVGEAWTAWKGTHGTASAQTIKIQPQTETDVDLTGAIDNAGGATCGSCTRSASASQEASPKCVIVSVEPD